VGTKPRLRVLIPIARRGMQPIKIRKWRVKYVIVARRNDLQNCRENPTVLCRLSPRAGSYAVAAEP
jgi:hypothetical protein